MNEAEIDALMARDDLTLDQKAEIIGSSDISEWLSQGEALHREGPRREIPMEVRSVRMSVETYDKLALLADAQGVKPTALIRLAVEEYVARAEGKLVDLAEARQALEVLQRVVAEAEHLRRDEPSQGDQRQAA
ncbi:MAG: hypothetical protein HOV79_18290 [Hamadaea sp.]|nr:hypothetical protein [Hamadaea sp.]